MAMAEMIRTDTTSVKPMAHFLFFIIGSPGLSTPVYKYDVIRLSMHPRIAVLLGVPIALLWALLSPCAPGASPISVRHRIYEQEY